MSASPFLIREFRQAHRRHAPWKRRLVIGCIGTAASLFCALTSSLDEPQKAGQLFHFYLLVAGIYLAVLPALRFSAGLFTEDRENHTLELIFGTGITAMELFTGKILGILLVASSDLLAIFPFLALPFLLGGVSLELFLATAACLPALLLFAMAVMVFTSTFCKNEAASSISGLFIIGGLAVGTPLPYWLGQTLTGSPPFSESFLAISPAFAPFLLSQSLSPKASVYFWPSIGATLIWSMVFFGAGAAILSVSWRQKLDYLPAGKGQKILKDLVPVPLAPSGTLDQNAYEWICFRERRTVVLAWGAVLLVCFLWLLGFVLWRHHWLSIGNFWVTAFLLGMVFRTFLSHAASRKIAHDRSIGALEFLLTTPLQPFEIVEGQLKAMLSHFRNLRLFIFILLLAMMGAGYFIRSWNIPSLISYHLVWGILIFFCVFLEEGDCYRSMWIGLNLGRSIVAYTARTLWPLLIFPMSLMNLKRSGGFSWISTFPTGHVIEIMVLVCLVIIVTLILFYHSTYPFREELYSQMRSIAQTPVPHRNDPRLKKWDGISKL